MNYSSAANYNNVYSKVTHKYLIKIFYNRTNKKEYDLQIWQYNICYTNIIAIKDVIIIEKVKEKKKLFEDIANTTVLAKVAQISSLVNFAEIYI